MLAVIWISWSPAGPRREPEEGGSLAGLPRATTSSSPTLKELLTKWVNDLAWERAANRISLASLASAVLDAMSAIVSKSSSGMWRISEMIRCFSSRILDTSSSFCRSFSNGVTTGSATRTVGVLTCTCDGSIIGVESTIFRISTLCNLFLGAVGASSSSSFLGMFSPSGGLEFCRSGLSSLGELVLSLKDAGLRVPSTAFAASASGSDFAFGMPDL